MTSEAKSNQLSEKEQRVVDALERQRLAPLQIKVTKASRHALFIGLGVFGFYVAVLAILLVLLVNESRNLYYSAGEPLAAAFHVLAIGLACVGLLFWLPPFRGLPGDDDGNYKVIPRGSSPFLYAIGDRLNQLTGAASEIEFRVSLGAHAMVFREKKKTIVDVGASVLWLLTTSQLVAVLAHEFAHTSQEGTRSVLAWIRRFNGRLARAYLPWPLLDSPLGDHPNFLQQVLVPVRNVFLEPLMQLHRILDAALKKMSREMEFDADSVAVEVAGAEPFKDGLRRVVLLELCQGEFLSGYEIMRESNYLPRDFSQPPAINANLLDEELGNRGGIQYREGGKSIYESHPSLKARIDHADSTAIRGVLPDGVDDCVLVPHLERVTLGLTSEAMLRLPIPPPDDAYVEIEEYVSRLNVVRLYHEAERRFFGGNGLARPSGLFQSKFVTKPVAEHVDTIMAELTALRAEHAQQADRIEDHLKTKSIHYVLPAKGFSDVIPAFEQLMNIGAKRMTLCFAALELEAVQNKCEASEELKLELSDHRETASLLPLLEPRVREIDHHFRSFGVAYQFGDGHRAEVSINAIQEALKGIEFIVDKSPYLYRDDRDTSLRDYLLGPNDYKTSLDALLQSGSRCLEAFRTLSSRIVGALCRVAEEVEAGLGFEPIHGTLPLARALPRRIASKSVMVRRSAAERAEDFKKKLVQEVHSNTADDATKTNDTEAFRKTEGRRLVVTEGASTWHLLWFAGLLSLFVGLASGAGPKLVKAFVSAASVAPSVRNQPSNSGTRHNSGARRNSNYGNPNYGNPNYGNPNYGNPNYGSPNYGSPNYGNPNYGIPGVRVNPSFDPMRANQRNGFGPQGRAGRRRFP